MIQGALFALHEWSMKVLERGREPCLGDERRGEAMSDLALALAFVAALALAVAAIYVAATSS